MHSTSGGMLGVILISVEVKNDGRQASGGHVATALGAMQGSHACTTMRGAAS